jgi:hypothetical protein
MLRAQQPKILLQQYLPITDVERQQRSGQVLIDP